MERRRRGRRKIRFFRGQKGSGKIFQGRECLTVLNTAGD